MTQPTATKIDTKMLHRGTVAIVFAILYVLLGLMVRGRGEWRGGAGFWSVGTPGTDSFRYVADLSTIEIDPTSGRAQTGFLDTTGSGTHPYLVRGWLGLLHPGIPVHCTQIAVTWIGDDGVRVPITSKQLWDKHVPLTSLPATARGSPLLVGRYHDTILEMLRNRQTTKWSNAWSDVAFLVAQAVCGLVCITAVVQWYRLLKTLGHVEAGGCIKCGYPIAPNTGTCPECGHVHGA